MSSNALTDRQISHVWGAVGLLTTLLIGVVGYLFVTDRFEFTDNRVQHYELEDNRTFEMLSSQLAGLQRDLDQVAADLAPAIVPAPRDRREFLSGLAAASDPDQLFAQNSYFYWDAEGRDAEIRLDMIAGLLRHVETGVCLWPNPANTEITTRTCDELQTEIEASSRDSYPLYSGWLFDEMGYTEIGGGEQDLWRLCFSPQTAPTSFDEFENAQSCLFQADGSAPEGQALLTARPQASHVNVASEPTGAGSVTIWIWGDDGAGRCLAVAADLTVVLQSAGCETQSFSLGRVQYVIDRSDGE